MNQNFDFGDGEQLSASDKKQQFKSRLEDLKPHEKREAKYVFELENAIAAQQRIRDENRPKYAPLQERLSKPVTFTAEDIRAAQPSRQVALFKLIEENASHWDFVNSSGDRYILVNTIDHNTLPKDEIARRDINIAAAILRQAIIDLKDPLQREHTLKWIHGEYDSLVSFNDAVNAAFARMDAITPAAIRNRIIEDEESVHDAMLKYKLFEGFTEKDESQENQKASNNKSKWYENQESLEATTVTLDRLIETGFRDPLMIVDAPGAKEFIGLLEAFGYNVGYFTREKKDKSAMLQTQFDLVELVPTGDLIKQSVSKTLEKKQAISQVSSESKAKTKAWLEQVNPKEAQVALALESQEERDSESGKTPPFSPA